MRKNFKTHPFAKNALLAVPLVIFVLLMDMYFPQKTPVGFQSFIVAFEFAQTIQDLNLLFSGLSVNEIQKIDIGNYIDFGFMLTYSLFLIVLFKKAAKEFNKKWLIVGVLMAIIALLTDFFENLILLKITEIYLANLNELLFIPLLEKLHFITWLKWGSLAFAFLFFSIELVKRNWFSKIVAFFCLPPFAFGIWALGGAPIAITYFTNSVFGAFTFLFVFSFSYKTNSIKH